MLTSSVALKTNSCFESSNARWTRKRTKPR